MRSREWRVLVQLGAKGQQQGLVVCESHAVRLERVALDLADESVLVRRTGLIPAFAVQPPVHDSSPANVGIGS